MGGPSASEARGCCSVVFGSLAGPLPTLPSPAGKRTVSCWRTGALFAGQIPKPSTRMKQERYASKKTAFRTLHPACASCVQERPWRSSARRREQRGLDHLRCLFGRARCYPQSSRTTRRSTRPLRRANDRGAGCVVRRRPARAPLRTGPRADLCCSAARRCAAKPPASTSAAARVCSLAPHATINQVR